MAPAHQPFHAEDGAAAQALLGLQPQLEFAAGRKSSVDDHCTLTVLADRFIATEGDIRNLLIAARRRGKSIDYLVVDYWELMGAAGYHRDERFNYKEIGEHLRMLGNEFKVPVLTGWQTNRAGYKAHLIEEEHIGEDISVKKTADIVVTLNQNKEERRTKRMRLGTLKQRGGSDYPTVDCYWDVDRMDMRDRTDADIEDNLSVKGSKDEDRQADDHEGAQVPVEA